MRITTFSHSSITRRTMYSAGITIIGFGSQGQSWAKNLRDSSRRVTIATREGSSSKKVAKSEGFNVISYSEISPNDAIALLIPDHLHAEVLKELIPFLKDGTKIIYAHGISLITGELNKLYPTLSHLLLAPKAIASELRNKYVNEGAIYAVASTQFVKSDSEKAWLKDLMIDLGVKEENQIMRSFSEETNADLFSEQSLLCSLIPYGALHSYNKLREQGISKEVAYIECWMEVKLIADAMIKYGPEKLFELISPNALIGGEKAQKIFFDQSYDQKLEKLKNDIWNNDFNKEIEQTDIKNLKSTVKDFWASQEITQVYNDFFSRQ